MDGVRVYSITGPQLLDLVGILQRIKASVVPALDGGRAELFETAECGAFGSAPARVPFA